MFIIPSGIAKLDSIVLTNSAEYKTAFKSGLLWSEIAAFYNGISPKNDYEKHILETNGIGHITNVVDNVKKVYALLGKEPSEEALAAAMCHDLGYLAYLFDDSKKYENKNIGERHHIYSAEIAGRYLKNFGFSESQISLIEGIIIAHDECPSYGAEEEKVVFIADKLTRLGKDGFERLCAAGEYSSNNVKRALKILDGVERRMCRTYADLISLGVASEYIEKEYMEGKKCLEEERESLKNGKGKEKGKDKEEASGKKDIAKKAGDLEAGEGKESDEAESVEGGNEAGND